MVASETAIKVVLFCDFGSEFGAENKRAAGFACRSWFEVVELLVCRRGAECRPGQRGGAAGCGIGICPVSSDGLTSTIESSIGY